MLNVTIAAKSVAQTKASQKALFPAGELALLVAGNQRFVSGALCERDCAAQVKATAAGQYPFAFVLGCVDARVSPEIVFDQGMGEICAARSAGNITTTDLLGSLEFATAVSGRR